MMSQIKISVIFPELADVNRTLKKQKTKKTEKKANDICRTRISSNTF